jgi:transcriptional regulator with XRE-family HTH domain
MAPRKRRAAQIAGEREARAIAASLGRETRSTRRRRRLTQAALGVQVGLGQSEISHVERGNGAGTSLETWVAIGMALDRPIAIAFSRDVADPLPRDAGHLLAQELVLTLAARTGRVARFELATRPMNPAFSVDVALRDPDGTLVVVEIWNRLDDLGAAVRSADRKLADLAAATMGRRLASCWILVDSAANREIVRRYPVILRTRFAGSAVSWVRALESGQPIPNKPGLIWADVRSGSLRPLRLHASR